MARWSVSTESAHKTDSSPVAGTGSTRLLRPHDLWNQRLYLVVPFKSILEKLLRMYACLCVCLVEAQHICSTWEKRVFSQRVVKHKPFLSLKEKLCFNQRLFAPAVMCLRTSAGANKHMGSAQLWRNKIEGWTKRYSLRRVTQRRLQQERVTTEAQWHKAGNPTIYFIPWLHVKQLNTSISTWQGSEELYHGKETSRTQHMVYTKGVQR